MTATDFFAYVEKLDAEAAPGKWEACLGSGFHECTAIHFEGNDKYPYGLFVCDLLPDWILDDKYKVDREFKNGNMDFIAASRSLLPAAVNALKLAREALGKVSDAGISRSALIVAADNAQKALTEIDSILSEAMKEIT